MEVVKDWFSTISDKWVKKTNSAYALIIRQVVKFLIIPQQGYF